MTKKLIEAYAKDTTVKLSTIHEMIDIRVTDEKEKEDLKKFACYVVKKFRRASIDIELVIQRLERIQELNHHLPLLRKGLHKAHIRAIQDSQEIDSIVNDIISYIRESRRTV